jgi:hypothetical protein
MLRLYKSKTATISDVRMTSIAEWKRFFVAVISGVRTTWCSVLHTLVVLANQVIGMFFFAFAVMGLQGCWRESTALNGAQWNSRMWVTVLFTAMFTWFTVLSFWKARRIVAKKAQ